jgi:hypothetical protein
MRVDNGAEGTTVAVTNAAVAKLNEAAAGGGYWNPDLAQKKILGCEVVDG